MLKKICRAFSAITVGLFVFAGCNGNTDVSQENTPEKKPVIVHLNGETNEALSFNYSIEDAVPGITSVPVNVKVTNLADVTDIAIRNQGNNFTYSRSGLKEDGDSFSRDFVLTVKSNSAPVTSNINFEIKSKSSDPIKVLYKLKVESLKAEDSSFAVSFKDITEIKDESVKLLWDVPAGKKNSFYNIAVYSGTTFVKEYVEELCEDNEFTVQGLSASTAYKFTVTAYGKDSSGNEGFGSKSVNVTTLEDMTPPAVPSNLTAGQSGLNKVSFSWTNPSDKDFNAVKVYLEKGDSDELLATLPKTQSSYNHVCSFASEAQVFKFKVSSVDLIGNESAKSAALSVSTVAVPVVSGISAEALSMDRIRLSWNSAFGAQDIAGDEKLSYKVQIFEDGEELTEETLIVETTSVEYSGLSIKKAYTFKVSVCNKTSDAVYSVSAVSDSVTLGEYSNISASAGATTQAVISWDGVEASEGYAYKVETFKNGSAVAGKSVLTKKTKAAVSGLDIGSKYTFKVSLCDAEGSSVYETKSCNSEVTIEYVLWNMKSGYKELMIHSATLIDSYNGNLKVSSDHVIGSDHDKDTEDDTGRSNFKYAYFMVMPALSDPSDPELISLMACGAEKDCNVVKNPVLSGKYAYFDVSNTKLVPAGSAKSSWGDGNTVEAVNARTNKLWIDTKENIGSENYKNASFRILEQNDFNKDAMSSGDRENVTKAAAKGYTQVPEYKRYPNGREWIYLKSDSGLYWQHAYCIFRGNEAASNDSKCAAIAHFEFRYTNAINLNSYK